MNSLIKIEQNLKAHDHISTVTTSITVSKRGAQTLTLFVTSSPSAAALSKQEITSLIQEELNDLNIDHLSLFIDRLPLTSLQNAMVAQTISLPAAGNAIGQVEGKITRIINPELLQKAWNYIVQSNPVLTTRFSIQSDGKIFQNFPLQFTAIINGKDWQRLGKDKQQEKIKQLIKDDRSIGFDLTSQSLIRFTTVQISPEEWHFLWTFHNAIIDEDSIALVIKQLFNCYDVILEKKELPPPVPDNTFQRFVCWLAAIEKNDGIIFWKQQLAKIEKPLELRCAQNHSKTNILQQSSSQDYKLPAQLTDKLRLFASECQVTIRTLVHAAWSIHLNQYSDNNNILFGSARDCRKLPVKDMESAVGMLVNTVPFTASLQPEEKLIGFLHHIHDLDQSIQNFEHIPFHEIQQVSLFPPGTPLFETLLIFHKKSINDILEKDFFHNVSYQGQAGLPISMLIYDGRRLTMNLEFDSERFSAATMQQFFHNFIRILSTLPAFRDSNILDIPCIDETQQKQLQLWNKTKKSYPPVQCLHHFFESVVDKTPDSIALIYQEQQLTYQNLETRANQLAHHLLSHNISPDEPVAIVMDRSVEMVICLYAILKAGGAYLPLDPEYPLDRLQTILTEASPRVLLTQSFYAEKLSDLNITLNIFCVDSEASELSKYSDKRPKSNSNPQSLAYIIYTSGSTGRPKGVMNQHEGICNRLQWMQERYTLTESDCVLQKTPYTFDVSVWEFFWPLMVGSRLVIAKPGGHRDSIYLVDIIKKHAVTTLHFVPSMLDIFLDIAEPATCSCIRQIFCSGEELPKSLQDRFFSTLDTNLYNLYGPTEAAVDVTHWHCQPDSKLSFVPIGYPVSNTSIYILNRNGQQTPIGVAGELFIGGIQVARGYLARQDLTKKCFIADHFSDHPNAKLYKTGDLARFLADGSIEYLGRKDFQVKFNGLRIELGEIESVLLSSEAIKKAVVICDDSAGNQRLLAYIILDKNLSETEQDIRKLLRTKLPSYMIPQHFIELSSFPLSANGKLDRKALPLPPSISQSPHPSSKSSLSEKYLQNLWSEILQINDIGVHDRFFEIGGSSLLAISIMTRLSKELNQHLPIVMLFEAPSISALSNTLWKDYFETMSKRFPSESESRIHPEKSTPAFEYLAALPEDEIAIIGMSGRFPGAANIYDFWDLLQAGKEASKNVTEQDLQVAGVDTSALSDPSYVARCFPLDDAEKFDANFFGYSPREAEILDPQHRLFLENAWNVLEDAGYNVRTCDARIGIFGGVARNGYLIHNICSHQELREISGEYQYMLGNEKDYPVNRAAYKLNLTGPAVNIQTACSSSGVAIHIACQSLNSSDCDMAIAGGCRVLVPHHTGYIHTDGGTLSADGHLRVFDKDASGMVRGSGGGCILLKRLQQAIKDKDTVYAVIKSSAINNDGINKAGFTAPSIQGQAEVITKAMAKAGVEAESIQYIEAHGTGTSLGDPIEVTALTQAFSKFTDKKQFCAIGSVKTNIGHLDAGACVSGIIKTVLAMNRKKIPPSLNFQQPNPAIDFINSPFYVNTTLQDWPQGKHPRRAGVSAFGLGGTNVHIVLEEAPVPPPAPSSNPYQIFLLSARDEDALKTYSRNLAQFLQKNESTNLGDMAYTLEVGRQHFQHRLYVVAQNTKELIEQLSLPKVSGSPRNQDSQPSIYFMFPGQGSQHINMGRDLYETEPGFKKDIDYCAEKLTSHLSLDLRDILFPSDNQAEPAATTLTQTHITQPALFVIEYALGRLWLSRGIKPAGMIGHSIGEFPAACLSGVFSLDDALATVAIRGRLMFDQPEGTMLAVRLSEKALIPFIEGQVSFAVSNAPERSVLSGPADEIINVKKRLQDKNIACTELHTSHAFHSSMMDNALPPFITHLESIRLNTPKIPFISSCTGTWISDEQATTPQYWAQQLRQPVRFSQGIQEILENDTGILLEVGPGTVLSVLSRQHVHKEDGRRIITSWDHAAKKHSALHCTLTALGQLWSENSAIKHYNFKCNERRSRISLPTYPFQRKRYWIDPVSNTQKENQERRPSFLEKPQIPFTNNLLPNPEQQETDVQPQQQLSRHDTIATALRKVLTELSGIDFQPSDDTNSFLSLGLDSLFLTQVIGKLKKNFGVNLKFRQLLEDFPDISSLTNYLDQELPADMFMPPPPQLSKNEETMPTTSLPTMAELPNTKINGSSLESVIAGQLHIMQQQLNILRGEPAKIQSPLPAATIQPLQKIAEKTSRSKKGTSTSKPFGAAVKISTDAQNSFTSGQKDFFHSFCGKYLKKTAGSKEYTKIHRPHLADPRVVSGFHPLTKELIYPIVVKRSLGTRMWDIDGNEYIDMTNAFGANFLGHSPEFITKVLQDQLQQGVEIGPQHPLTGEVAQLICEFSGQDRAVFCNTGSEAVLGAMRISRTVTGRDTIVVFTDDYHGMFDEVIVRGTPSLKSIPAASGIPSASVENVLVLEYGADESLKIIREHAKDIAAILVEPVQSRNLDLQPREFLHQLRHLTNETEIVLIFDEVITGFRSHLYGAQKYFEVKADIVTYGKIVGGGMPIGVIAGKSQYLDALDGGMWQYGDSSIPEAGVTYFAGTFVRHPLALAAAKATLKHLKQAGPQLQETLNSKTDEFVTKLKNFLIAVQAPIQILHFSSAFQFSFTEDPLANSLFFPLLRDKGIHIFPGRTWFFTTAFDDADFSAVMQAVQETITELQTAGFLSGNPVQEKKQHSSTSNSPSFPTTPPVPGARLGKCPDGTPAWFVPDLDRPGKFLQLEIK